jgi:hypothetical protein
MLHNSFKTKKLKKILPFKHLRKQNNSTLKLQFHQFLLQNKLKTGQTRAVRKTARSTFLVLVYNTKH